MSSPPVKIAIRFNPRSPWGERPAVDNSEGGDSECFNPRSPWGERLWRLSGCPRALWFQSTLPVGGATIIHKTITATIPFQSTLPVGGATPSNGSTQGDWGCFNPRSPWGERQLRLAVVTQMYYVSIHAPRGGSDSLPYVGSTGLFGVSIHAPRGGSDLRTT